MYFNIKHMYVRKLNTWQGNYDLIRRERNAFGFFTFSFGRSGRRAPPGAAIAHPHYVFMIIPSLRIGSNFVLSRQS